MPELELFDTFAHTTLGHVVWLELGDKPDNSDIPHHGVTRASLIVRPPIALVHKVIREATDIFKGTVHLEHDESASEATTQESDSETAKHEPATVLKASIETEWSESLRRRCLRELAVRVLLAANGGGELLARHQLPFDPYLPLEPPHTDPH